MTQGIHKMEFKVFSCNLYDSHFVLGSLLCTIPALGSYLDPELLRLLVEPRFEKEGSQLFLSKYLKYILQSTNHVTKLFLSVLWQSKHGSHCSTLLHSSDSQFSLFSLFLNFGHAVWLVGSQFPYQGSNPGLLRWRCRALTTGPSRNSHNSPFKFNFYFILECS